MFLNTVEVFFASRKTLCFQCVSVGSERGMTQGLETAYLYIYFETSHKNVIRLHEFSKESVPLSLPSYQLCMQVPAVYILCVLGK